MERVLIVGTGFMGGSLALALRRSGFEGEIYGIDKNPEALKKAKELGVIEEGFTEYGPVKEVAPDTVVIATPVRTFTDIARNLKGVISEDTVITDLGSVKGMLVFKLEEILGTKFVGGHPIAGTEKSGVENSLPDLFEGKKTIITPTERTDKEALKKVVEMWETLGSEVEFMDPFLHDRVFGAVSHLPHAVAFALIDAIERLSEEVDLFRYPGGGFKDFTRIAASDPVMWRDIFLENRENVIRSIDVYVESLKKLRGLIEEGREEDLTRFLENVRVRRMNLR